MGYGMISRMGDDVEHARRIVELLEQRLAAEDLTVTFEFPTYERPCGVHLRFPDGDWMQLEVSQRVDTVRILDPDLTPAELADYVVMRARGASPKETLAVLAAGDHATRPRRWWRRRR